MLLADNVGGKEAGPLTPLSVDSSSASPESGVLPAEVFGLEPSLNRLNSPVKLNEVRVFHFHCKEKFSRSIMSFLY